MTAQSHDFDRAVAILRLALIHTRNMEITWKRPSHERPHAFDVDLPSGTIEIGTTDDDSVAPFDLRIYTSGPPYNLVLALDSRENEELLFPLKELHDLVSLQVIGANPTLEGLFNDLGGNDLPF